MKMYILIKETAPLGLAMVAAAHASLTAFRKFEGAPETQLWIAGPFRKTICKVSDAEFEAAKEVADHIVLTESARDNREIAIAFKPRLEWPKVLKYYRLYK